MGKRNGFLLALKTIVLLAVPVLFFSYVGHDPLKITPNTNTRNIAIVNEDDGSSYMDNHLNMGQRVAEVMDKGSEYKWTIVNRGMAESGLQNKQYDAVIYLPSTFTSNVLTFNEEEPVKAGIKYKLQSNLSAENAERVQKELEAAKNQINTRVSRIYWDYVSQSMEDIRKKFDTVLEKEIAFQETMYNFYNPNSKSLASEIESQKKMLETIISTTNSASETSVGGINQVEGTKPQIETFLTAVSTFKDYQEKQAEVMAEASAVNQKLIQDSVKSYDKIIKDGINMVSDKEFEQIPEFGDRTEEMFENIQSIQEDLQNSNQSIQDLNEGIESSNVKEQFERLMNLQKENMISYKSYRINTALDIVQPEMIAMRKSLQEPGTPDVPEDPEFVIPETPEDKVDIASVKAKLEELKAIAAKVQTTDPAQLESLNQSITELENALMILEKQLQEQNSSLDEWKASVGSAAQDSNANVTNEDTGTEQTIVEQIRSREQHILHSGALSEERKNVLQSVFNTEIAGRDVEKLLQYHYYVSVYAGELSQAAINDEKFIEELIGNGADEEVIMDAFEKIKAETQLFYQLQGSMEDSLEKMDVFEEDFYTFANGVDKFVEDFGVQYNQVHDEIMVELFHIEGSASSVSENLKNETIVPEIEPAPGNNLNGEFLLSMQDGSMVMLEGIYGMINNISEQQTSVTSYTDELQTKVGSVQNRADDLNNRWAENVGVTKNVKEDVYGLLDNTIVDGQQNPFVYDYLSNPVQLSGEEFLKKTTAPTPPVLMLVVILLTGLVIGLFLHHLSGVNMFLHIALFLLLTLASGVIITLFGMEIYPMHDNQAVKWSIITILLLMACTALVRLAYFIGPFVGALITIVLIVYFTTPLLDLVLPNFSSEHPVADLMMNIQQGSSDHFAAAMVVLMIITILTSIIPYTNMFKSSSESMDEAVHEA